MHKSHYPATSEPNQPKFKTADPRARLGIRSTASEEFSDTISKLRRNIVDPSGNRMEAKLEKLLSDLASCDAKCAEREAAASNKIVEMETRLAGALVRSEMKHHQLIVEIGNAISALGADISKLGAHFRVKEDFERDKAM